MTRKSFDRQDLLVTRVALACLLAALAIIFLETMP